jgi:hypothetical protein
VNRERQSVEAAAEPDAADADVALELEFRDAVSETVAAGFALSRDRKLAVVPAVPDLTAVFVALWRVLTSAALGARTVLGARTGAAFNEEMR